MSSSNLVKWITEEAKGEPIEGVVIGEMGWGDYGSESVPGYSEQPRNKLISWDEAKKYLDYEFDSGFGAAECNAIYAWTTSRVLYVSQYDGATAINSLPRNPADCKPEMPGG